MIHKAMMLGGLIVAGFALIFLGGLASAWWEVRAEKRAGVPVTRPAWDAKRNREARGTGVWGSLKLAVYNLKSPLPLCSVCGLGPITYFNALDNSNSPTTRAGNGCAAVEAGHPDAARIHEAAGGYSRTFAPGWEPPGYEDERAAS